MTEVHLMNVRKLWLAVALVAALCIPTLDAVAKSVSSRGYSAPSMSRSSVPPSLPSVPSTAPAPRSGNGYGLPGQTAAPRGSTAPLGGSDAAMSKQTSGSALRSYDAAKEQRRFAASSPSVAAPSQAFSGYAGRFRSYDDYAFQRRSYYSGYGWQPPGYIYGSRPSFGMWDALFLWFMLDSVSNASHALWFHDHYDDPGYQQWRQEADRLSADNADLRAKLDQLDAQQKALAGQPRDPSRMPPDTKPELALAAENAVAPEPAPSSGTHWLLDIGLVVLVGGGLLFLRRRMFA
ncbi:MAG TPA: hypothetical protein VM689_01000 [Aliidongia sp.]|nr:hypothetical protein [Aliidongia sp.]